MLAVLCPACGKHLKAKPELAGKKAKCSCGKVITIPSSGEIPQSPVMTGERQWQTVISGSSLGSSAAIYKAYAEDVWQAIIDHVSTMSDAQILNADATTCKLIYQSKCLGQIAVVSLREFQSASFTMMHVEVFDDPSVNPNQRLSIPEGIRGTALFAGIKVAVLDKRFREIKNINDVDRSRARGAGLIKLLIGAGFTAVGVALTMAFKGQVLFYGMFLVALFFFLTGALQVLFGREFR